MKLIIASTRSNDPEVHAVNCDDVARGLRSGKYQGAYRLEVKCLDDAALDFWSDIIDESEDEDKAMQDAINHWTRYLPCTRTHREGS